MGVVYTASCPTCNYKKDFFLGFGFNSINLFSSAQVLKEEEQKEIHEIDSNREIKDFSVENKLTECTHCNTPERLKEKVVITITKQNGDNLVFGNKCSHCEKELKTYNSLMGVSCPCCKDSSLTFEETGHWD